VVTWLVLGSVTLVTAVAFWANLLGYLGVVVVAGLLVIGLLVAIALPEPIWVRLTGGTPLADELGAFQVRGLELVKLHPRVDDKEENAEAVDAWKKDVEAWAAEVYELLDEHAPRWKGVFLTAPGHIHFSGAPYAKWNAVDNWRRDRLEQLSKIIAALEPHRGT
jgi:hypothetical protein